MIVISLAQHILWTRSNCCQLDSMLLSSWVIISRGWSLTGTTFFSLNKWTHIAGLPDYDGLWRALTGYAGSTNKILLRFRHQINHKTLSKLLDQVKRSRCRLKPGLSWCNSFKCFQLHYSDSLSPSSSEPKMIGPKNVAFKEMVIIFFFMVSFLTMHGIGERSGNVYHPLITRSILRLPVSAARYQKPFEYFNFISSQLLLFWFQIFYPLTFFFLLSLCCSSNMHILRCSAVPYPKSSSFK